MEKIIIDCSTGESATFEMTEEEVAANAALAAEIEANILAQEQAAAEKAAVKQAVLDRLGLTAEEAAALLS